MWPCLFFMPGNVVTVDGLRFGVACLRPIQVLPVRYRALLELSDWAARCGADPVGHAAPMATGG